MLCYIIIHPLSGCTDFSDLMPQGSREIDQVMDKAESLLDDYPEIADSLMGLIRPGTIHNKERNARYSLLFTGARLRNHRTIENDSLILIAVEHYSSSKNTEYEFLSYYYLGCVYAQMERNVDAAIVLAQAEKIVDKIDNEYWKGLLYSQTAKLYRKSHDRKRAMEYYDRAHTCYKSAGKEQNSRHTHSELAGWRTDSLENAVQDSTLHQVQNWSMRNFKGYNTAIRNVENFLVVSFIMFLLILITIIIVNSRKQKKIFHDLSKAQILIQELNEANQNRDTQLIEKTKQLQAAIRERQDMSNHLFNVYIDSENQEKITKQKLKVFINSIKRSYNSPENIRKLDQQLNDNFDCIMEKVSNPELNLSEKEIQVIRLSISGLSAMAISTIIDESTQNIYKIKSRLKVKIKKRSNELDDLIRNYL